eukprot:GHVQ01033653.1.p1 GENE.GHVQ01033653.1~~GHVQ01033653.1.p1  ORF type:complete len:774 (+),score=134.84 GHVQ01033653.1:169-2490(+)
MCDCSALIAVSLLSDYDRNAHSPVYPDPPKPSDSGSGPQAASNRNGAGNQRSSCALPKTSRSGASTGQEQMALDDDQGSGTEGGVIEGELEIDKADDRQEPLPASMKGDVRWDHLSVQLRDEGLRLGKTSVSLLEVCSFELEAVPVVGSGSRQKLDRADRQYSRRAVGGGVWEVIEETEAKRRLELFAKQTVNGGIGGAQNHEGGGSEGKRSSFDVIGGGQVGGGSKLTCKVQSIQQVVESKERQRQAVKSAKRERQSQNTTTTVQSQSLTLSCRIEGDNTTAKHLKMDPIMDSDSPLQNGRQSDDTSSVTLTLGLPEPSGPRDVTSARDVGSLKEGTEVTTECMDSVIFYAILKYPNHTWRLRVPSGHYPSVLLLHRLMIFCDRLVVIRQLFLHLRGQCNRCLSLRSSFVSLADEHKQLKHDVPSLEAFARQRGLNLMDPALGIGLEWAELKAIEGAVGYWPLTTVVLLNEGILALPKLPYQGYRVRQDAELLRSDLCNAIKTRRQQKRLCQHNAAQKAEQGEERVGKQDSKETLGGGRGRKLSQPSLPRVSKQVDADTHNKRYDGTPRRGLLESSEAVLTYSQSYSMLFSEVPSATSASTLAHIRSLHHQPPEHTFCSSICSTVSYTTMRAYKRYERHLPSSLSSLWSVEGAVCVKGKSDGITCEDSAFCLFEEGTFGVFDGVGSWSAGGIDPSDFSRGMAEECAQRAREALQEVWKKGREHQEKMSQEGVEDEERDKGSNKEKENGIRGDCIEGGGINDVGEEDTGGWIL